jgi:hypothetical protein
MEMAWRDCPRCTGRRARDEVVGRGMTDQTVMLGASPVAPPDPVPQQQAAPKWVALLTASAGPLTGRDFQVTPGRWRFGRSPSAEGDAQPVAVPDPGMSRNHFALEAGVAAVVLKDLGSTNGTFVDGARIERHILRDGDQIRAGDTIFTVRLALRVSAA